MRLFFYIFLQGETKLIATVKAEIDAPDFNTPNLGKLDFYVDWLVFKSSICLCQVTIEFRV